MTKNNVTIIDGVSYDLSPADSKLLQQIMARSRVKNNPVAKKLNDTVVKNLIGHTDVVYYNFEKGAWNTSTYNGYQIIEQEKDTERAQVFDAAMERESVFSTQYEMVAIVTMTINRTFFNGLAKPVSNPIYNGNGLAVVGNIIVKDKTTGKYELYCKSWIGVKAYRYLIDAVCMGAFGFANAGAWNHVFRNALIAAHTR